jgi:hypothetical protein
MLTSKNVWIKKTNAVGCLIEFKKKQLAQNNL